MRTSLVGIAVVACALGCGGGSGGGGGDGSEAAFYDAYCKRLAACNDNDPSEQECLAFIPGNAQVARLVPDLEAATSCIQSATSCDAVEACMPRDMTANCRSATALELCRGGTCVQQDCGRLCEFMGHSGVGTCGSDGPDDAYCDCSSDSAAP